MKPRWPFLVLALPLLIFGCGPADDKPTTTTTTTTAANTNTTASTTKDEGLKELEKTDVKVGTGEQADTGDLVIVHYKGTFKDGTQFDASLENGFVITLGMSPVIEGWHQGIPGMKEGGVRKLGIPHRLAYGDRPNGQIPPRTDLYFEITLLGVVNKGEETMIQPTEVKQGSGKAIGPGDTVTIHAVAKLVDGTVVQDTRTKNEPQTFVVGGKGKPRAYNHIDTGVRGMKKGGIRKLKVPPQAAFGSKPMGMIPPDSILMYEVEVIDVKPGK